MKKTLLFTLLMATVCACNGTAKTNASDAGDSVATVGDSTVASDTAPNDDPDDAPYLTVCGSDGLPVVFSLLNEDGNPKVAYWCSINHTEGTAEEQDQQLFREHMKDYTVAIDGNIKYNVRYKSELLPEDNEDDWTKGVTTGMLGATLRMAGVTYEFTSAAAKRNANDPEMGLSDMVITTKTFADEHPILSVERTGEYDDEGRAKPMPSDIVSQLEKRYGQKCTRSELGYRIGGRYTYGVMQFEAQGDKMLGLEVLTDGQQIWTMEMWGNCSEGPESSVWNVDDGGEYFLSGIMAACEGKDGVPILFFERSAPESQSPGWMTVKDGKIVRSYMTMYYVYYN